MVSCQGSLFDAGVLLALVVRQHLVPFRLIEAMIVAFVIVLATEASVMFDRKLVPSAMVQSEDESYTHVVTVKIIQAKASRIWIRWRHESKETDGSCKVSAYIHAFLES